MGIYGPLPERLAAWGQLRGETATGHLVERCKALAVKLGGDPEEVVYVR